MNRILSKDRRIAAISIAAAAATAIAGIMHLLMVPHGIPGEGGEGVLFLVGGFLQVFWTVPVLKGWGRAWQIIGIGGTVVFMILWFATHTHSLFGLSGGQAPHEIAGGNLSSTAHHEGLQESGGFRRGPPPRGLASIPAIEYFQAAFVGLYAALGVMISRKPANDQRPRPAN